MGAYILNPKTKQFEWVEQWPLYPPHWVKQPQIYHSPLYPLFKLIQRIKKIINSLFKTKIKEGDV